MQKTQVDPIITEVRAVRDDYAARFNYDVGKMFRDLQARQKTSDSKYSCYPARWLPEFNLEIFRDRKPIYII